MGGQINKIRSHSAVRSRTSNNGLGGKRMSSSAKLKKRITSASTNKSKKFANQVGLSAEQQDLVAQSEYMMQA